MVEPLIPYAKPSITLLERKFVARAARNGWGKNAYSYISKFESVFAHHIGSKYAIATSSCTGALHMGLAALGIGIGDEVIVADINWIATVAPIVQLGAKPIFVDIDPQTWCIDSNSAENAITSRTKAIIVTHLYGNLADMSKLLEIGIKYGISIIEDAAEAIGSQYQGKRAGALGKFGTFSFHGSKTITTGEGGMFVTSDIDLYEMVLTLSNHGRVKGQIKQFFPEFIGFKYKMSNIQAALGYAQMKRVEELILRKQEILQNYRVLLRHPEINMNYCQPGNTLGAWMPTVVFSQKSGVSKDKAIEALGEANIDARTFFHPLTTLPMFNENSKNPISYEIAARAINLPSFHDMKNSDQERVSKTILKLL